MASKIRGVKPETWTDSKFVRLSPLARLLFLGMWNFSCDNGHIEDDAVQLKIRILPMDSCHVGELVAEMLNLGLVQQREGYLKVPNLPKHQKIDMRFLTLCDHCEHDEHSAFSEADRKSRTGGAPSAPAGRSSDARRVHDVQAQSAQSEPPESTPCTRVDGDGDGDGDEKHALVSVDSIEDDFDEWYSEYPRKVARGRALKAYRTARKRATASVLLDALRSQTPKLTARGTEFVPYPASWLNGERWTDEPEALPDERSGWDLGEWA